MAVANPTYKRLFARPEALMAAMLGAAIVFLLAAAVIGARRAEVHTVASGNNAESVADEYNGGQTSTGKTPVATSSGAKGTAKGVGGAVGQQSGGSSKSPAAVKEAERTSTVGATREGVHGDYFEVGVHGPITFDGVPLGLADDPVTGIKGYVTYLNRRGGINGLKIRLYIEDDRYTTAGGKSVGDKLAKEIKPFFIEGTLGIDQIHKVALAAHGAGIPYLAGGGPEPELKDIGMYQIYTSYDADAKMLASFICKYGKSYLGAGQTEVRLGTSTLSSDLIEPVEQRFVNMLSGKKCSLPIAAVDKNARGRVQKPTEQDTYGDIRAKWKSSYGGKGANLLVPFQDPVTTSREVLEMRQDPTYNPKWTFSNFAHDGDTELALFQGTWTGVRGLSPACYYYPPQGGVQSYNEALCAKMGEAHREFVSLGNVTYDENAGGSSGNSKSSYNYQEGDGTSDGWLRDGSGAAFGYQIVYAWVKAMNDIGTDPTREKFLAALNKYSNYSNLITGPITFAGSPNKMIGADKFVVLEGTASLKYKQVADITPGLVDHF